MYLGVAVMVANSENLMETMQNTCLYLYLLSAIFRLLSVSASRGKDKAGCDLRLNYNS